ncbi:SH3 domain-containing protein [Celeribacter marinus]|uniref:SH3 domain-containing protein n=1 Tax=Celeribacter marinus TaxID=1397108 RepID=UPI0031764515
MSHPKTTTTTIAAVTLSLWAGLACAEMMQVTGLPDGDSLNVRKGPNASSADIGDLHEGEVIDVLGSNFARTWSQIRYRGETAWVASSYLANIPHGGGNAISVGPHVVAGIAADDPDGGLVVRDGAGTGFAALGVLRNDTAVHIIQTSPDGKWGMIALAQGVGWVSTRYLVAMTATPEPMPTADPQTAPDGGPLPAVFTVTGVSTGDMLWVRDAPQSTGARIGGLTPGAVVNINGRASGDWVQITLNGQIGYVNATYLTRTAQSGGGTTVNGFPLGITCRGTEPFWSFTIADDRTVEFTSLISGPDPITSLTQATPSVGGGYPFDFTAPPFAGAINAQACSDGMSDIVYSMSLVLTNPSGGWTGPLYGCCNVD